MLATDSASPRTSPPPIPQPRATPSIRPRSVAIDDLDERAGDRDRPDRGQVPEREVDPHPEHQQDDPDVGELEREIDIGDEAGGERAEQDAGHDVADDRRQSDPLGDEAADEGGHQADRDGRDEYGLVVHGSSRAIGWAQDWRGSVPERRLGLAGQRYPTRSEAAGRAGCLALCLGPRAGARRRARQEHRRDVAGLGARPWAAGRHSASGPSAGCRRRRSRSGRPPSGRRRGRSAPGSSSGRPSSSVTASRAAGARRRANPGGW